MVKKTDPDNTAVIVGSGPAGMSAAIYAKASNLDVVLIEQAAPGGQILRTSRIDNYLGFKMGTSAYEMYEKFQEHLESFEVEPMMEAVAKIVPGSPNSVETTGGETFLCKAVIVATGARPRLLGIPGEWRLLGKGVSTCAVCDGNFFKGQTVAVVGGGTTAVEDVIYLSNLAGKVYHIHRRDQLRLAGETSTELNERKNVERVFSSNVIEVLGEEKVEAIRVKNLNDESERELKLDGLFVAVGVAPNTDFLGGILELDETGFVVTDENMNTSVAGVFAAGDVRAKALRQVCTAVADGAMAAISAARYITGVSLW